jgi:hypothetical protein
MPVHSGTVRFRDYDDFFGAIADAGKVGNNGSVCRWEAPFAVIETEVYRLPEEARLKLFEIRPVVNIEIPYEFDDAHFEMTYCISGGLVLEDKYCGRGMFRANCLSLTQTLRSRGEMIFCRGQIFRGIIYSSARKLDLQFNFAPSKSA